MAHVLLTVSNPALLHDALNPGAHLSLLYINVILCDVPVFTLEKTSGCNSLMRVRVNYIGSGFSVHDW